MLFVGGASIVIFLPDFFQFLFFVQFFNADFIFLFILFLFYLF